MLIDIDVKRHRKTVLAPPDVKSHRVPYRTFPERWKEAREAAKLGANALDRLIGQSTGYTSRIEDGTKVSPDVFIVARAATVLGVRLGWLVDGEGPRPREQESDDPAVGTVLLKLRRLPGLEGWVEENPQKLTVSQLARGLRVYDEVKPRSRDDGQPLGGWASFFEDALAGKLTKLVAGDQKAAESLELSQLTPKGRKRVRRDEKP